MTREMIITELKNRGYNAEAQTNIKNGVAFEGIRIMANSNVAPVIYTDDILRRAEEENKNLDEVVSAIIGIYEANCSIDFDINELFDREFVLSHLYIGLQKESTEELIKRSCDLEGIESYLYIRRDRNDGEGYSVKLNEGILERANITEKEAWRSAEYNTNRETKIQSMASVMAELYGMDDFEEFEGLTPLYVISNECKMKGASAILNKEALAQFARSHNTEDMDLDYFSAMVREVNNTEVRPEERLTDRAYIVTV